jgi:hypothetical protein
MQAGKAKRGEAGADDPISQTHLHSKTSPNRTRLPSAYKQFERAGSSSPLHQQSLDGFRA